MAHPRADQVHDGESVNEMDTHTHTEKLPLKASLSYDWLSDSSKDHTNSPSLGRCSCVELLLCGKDLWTGGVQSALLH